ncbi:hypothetical protein HPB47_027169 [Ixodes persulcatus]|uniref:Uncharacterized protein n=1 Tax=Ixodes persulcatus TaxID=34615 RepID=A0AC60PX18_IXOPE|nr:hypothetical protein HPB47_027169 [Ixodes persulcatus]
MGGPARANKTLENTDNHSIASPFRLAQITQEAATYAKHLSQQNWSQFCAKLQGTIGSRRTWYLLRYLMGNKESRSAVAHPRRRIIHNYQSKEEELLEELKKPPSLPPNRTIADNISQNSAPACARYYLRRLSHRSLNTAHPEAEINSHLRSLRRCSLPAERCLTKLPWPPKGADLNIIENIGGASR